MPEKKQKNTLSSKTIIYSIGILTSIIFIVMVFFSRMARAALFISIFIVLNMVISSYKRFIKVPIEFEVLTLGIVICTLKFGLKAGLIIAVLGGILSFIISLNISPFAFPMLMGYVIMAVISYALRGADLMLVGFTATILNNIFLFTVYHFTFSYDIVPNLSFSLSNIILNLIMFANIAPIIMKLIF